MRKITGIIIGTFLMFNVSAQTYQKVNGELKLITGGDTLTIDGTAKYTTALLQNIKGTVATSTNAGDESLVWDALTRSIKRRLITGGGGASNWTLSGADIYNNNAGIVNVTGDFQQGTNTKGMKVQTRSGYTGIWFDQATPDFTNYNFLYDFGIGKTVLNGPTGVSLRAGNDYNASVSIRANKSLWVNNHEGINEGEYLNEIFHVNGGSFNKLESPLQLGFGIKGALGQTEDLIKVVDSINLPLFKITGNGTAEFNNGILAKGSTMLRIEGAAGSLPYGATGAGLEISNDRILRYNRSSAQFLPLEIAGSTINITGNLNVASLASGSTAPTTSGTTRMAVFDANGLLSTEVKPSGGTGGADSTKIPLSGTVTGKTITGGLEFANTNLSIIQNTVAGDYRSLSFNAAGKDISLTTSEAGIGMAITVNKSQVLINAPAAANSKGIVGVRNYSANYDTLSYVQKIYVDKLLGPGSFKQTAIPFANASGILTSDSTKLSYSSDYIFVGATASSSNGIIMNGGRAEINGQFSGMYFNIGSGKAAGGVYDASKNYIFQNRGNTYLQMGSATVSGGNYAAFSADVSSTGTVKTGGYTVATLPAGTTGMMAYVTDGASVTYLGAVVGGGTTVVPVFKNATGWVYH